MRRCPGCMATLIPSGVRRCPPCELANRQLRGGNGWRMSRLRDATIARDGLVCRLCGRTLTRSEARADHVLPVAKGYAATLGNLQVLCRKCNHAKGAKSCSRRAPRLGDST